MLFVELDEVHAEIDQGAHLAVDERNQRLGDFPAILVHLAALQTARQCERTRHRHFHGRRCDRPQTPIFLGQTESFRCVKRTDAAIAAALIVGRRTPAPPRRQRLDAAEKIVKAEIEIDALHLAVGDEVGPRAELIVHRQAHRVAQRLFAVIGTEQLRVTGRVVTEFGIPAGERPAADDRRRENREVRHAGNVCDRDDSTS